MERYNKNKIDKIIQAALDEDIVTEDITTNAIYKKEQKIRIKLLAKEDGVLAGSYVFERVFKLLDEDIYLDFKLKDGDEFKDGDLLCIIEGQVRGILTGERTALNFIQRMSGIASYTRDMVKLLEGSNIDLMDTRKTSPNLRIFEKYAVRQGGGKNHRSNLSDVIMLKDNHIAAAGGVGKAIKASREYAPYIRTIVVEVENLQMVEEALENKADIIMLDNMDYNTMKKAVELIAEDALIECSGNITKDRIKELKELNLDYISSGALTHSSGIIDMSLKELENI